MGYHTPDPPNTSSLSALQGLASQLSPQQIGGIIADYNGDLGVTTVAGRVSAWADQSGSVDPNHTIRQATAGSRPTYTASDAAYNGHGTLSFAAADPDYLIPPGTWATSLVGPAWVAVVGQSDLSTPAAFFFDDVSTLENWCLIAEPGTDGLLLLLNTGGNNEAETLVPQAIIKAPMVVLGQFGNNAGTNWSNGLVNARAALGNVTISTGNATLTGLVAGIDAAGGDPLNGKIARIIVGTGILNSRQQLGLANYLCSLYGVAPL